MTSLKPREPYSTDELRKIYPVGLELQLVQILFRHGERTPITARFQNTGLPSHWPYCSVARQMISSTLEVNDKNNQWTKLQWRKLFETFGRNDGATLAVGPGGESDSICNMGELTDTGRISTYKLGQRLRYLYIDRLKFMPKTLEKTDMIYLRATPIPRALESLHQVFRGMYPTNNIASGIHPITIITRTDATETLYPNERNCKRFAQLSRAFAQRAADRWNNTTEMEYLNNLISKWMPEDSKRVAVDSHPRLSGIMDSVNSTLAHGPGTSLPEAFYDPRGREIMDKISVDEWFSGFQESQEYRTLGIGSLMGDLVERMVDSVKSHRNLQPYNRDGFVGAGRVDNSAIKLALSGCHDTTLAAILSALGGFKDKPWPPYTSHVALELFRSPVDSLAQTSPKGNGKTSVDLIDSAKPVSMVRSSRQKFQELPRTDRSELASYFVRVRYNDEVITIPGCTAPGNHLDKDETLCTLAPVPCRLFKSRQLKDIQEAFKCIVDKYVPLSWRKACQANLDAPAFPEKKEPAGY